MMTTVIFYFSASGNSLLTAKKLKSKLQGTTELVPIVSLKETASIPISAESVGFVFPVFGGDLPYIFKPIISRMEFSGKPYIWSLCTYGGYAGDIAARFQHYLSDKSQKLSLNLGIPMPGNMRVNPPEKNEQALNEMEANLDAVAVRLNNRETEDYSSLDMPPLSPYGELGNIRGIMSDEKCVGCGLCAKLCPMENARIENSRSVFGNECMTCMTCYHWCPNGAIFMSKSAELSHRPQYRCPGVTVSDIEEQKKF